VTYQPYTEPGEVLSEYLNTATREINTTVTDGQSYQPAFIEAMEAAALVSDPGADQSRVTALDSARRQVKEKVNAYLRRRAAEREVKVFREGSVAEINISGGNLTNVNFMVAKRIQDVRVSMQASTASEELKAAVTKLTQEAEDLTTALPDDASKAQVAAAVETIAVEAQKDSPTEFLVKAAGQALVQAGQKVKDLSEPIASAVDTVLRILKIAL
jgi:hypothetical protein